MKINNPSIQSSYTSVLISANLDINEDVQAYNGNSIANKEYRINHWFWEPIKQKHFLKLIGSQNRTFYAHAGGVDCLRVSVLQYKRPVTTKNVYVRTEEDFINAFNNLQSNTTVLISPGVYRIQQEKLYQHTFVNLENIQILAKGVIVSGFKIDKKSEVLSHQTQAFGLKNGEWKRMNPKNPVGPGAAVVGSVDWTAEDIALSPLLGFMVNPDKTITHNAEDIKVSNSAAPNLWKFTHCKNIHIQDLTVEGYNSVFPNYSSLGCAFELQGCENFHFLRCKFDRLGGAAVSALNTQKICNLLWFHQCTVIDDNDEITYIGMRHSGQARSSGLIYLNSCVNCSITECKFIGGFFTILDNNGINNDYVSNYFERVRNHPLGVHGMTGFGLAAWKNTFLKCGNPLPSNEELAQVGPSFWFNNTANESGWNGTDNTLKYKGMSGSVSQGNRLGGTSQAKQLGGIHLYDNYVHVAGIDNSVDTIVTYGLSLSNRSFSRLSAIGNKWVLTNTGLRTANIVRHYEEFGKTDCLANNLKRIQWLNNILEWDKESDKTVFFGMNYYNSEEFEALFLPKIDYSA